MFIVTCTQCGTKEEWKTGLNVTEAKIQGAGFSVFCECGAAIHEEEEVLREETIIDTVTPQ